MRGERPRMAKMYTFTSFGFDQEGIETSKKSPLGCRS